MGRKKKPNKSSEKKTFNIELAHLMADEYMRMADRLIKKVPTLEKIDKQENPESSASIYIAISSLAFAIEVHFKSLLYTLKKGTRDGHNLAMLWNSLPKDIQTWLSEVFDQNFDSESKKWAYIVSWSPPHTPMKPGEKRAYNMIKIKTPENSAFGMIKGHRNAFQQGRYAYESPPAPKLKAIMYNLDGLQLLAWLTRGLAIHLHKEFELARKTGKIKEKGDHLSLEFNLPKSIQKFPHNETD